MPWALHAEEKAERDYLKSLEFTSQDEVAGNVWIEPEFGEFQWNLVVGHPLRDYLALELAAEYGLFDWVRALLDPSEITQTPSSAKKQSISAPPKFDMPPDKLKLAPASTKKTPRPSSMRSQ